MKRNCVSVRWKGRHAVRLRTESWELISLTGGGHLAAFRFNNVDGCPQQNLLWEAPWATHDPVRCWSEELSRLYGPPQTSKFLARFTGHALCFVADLPLSELTFERDIRLGNDQGVAYVQETVHNKRDKEHRCNWVQHVTLGQPFLDKSHSTLIASAESRMTSSFGYEGDSLLPTNCYFSWPHVQRDSGCGAVDLRFPFTQRGRGFLAGVRLDP